MRIKKSIIYTKTGDKGATSLVGGTRVSKAHVRLDVYGTVDELNSYLGWLMCEIKEEDNKQFLLYIQHKMFTIGSYFATETEKMDPKPPSVIYLSDIEKIEKEIDRIDHQLPKIKQFILPGGNESSSRAHICRTIARKVERYAYRLDVDFPVDENVLVFINRLSDYLFVLARFESVKANEEIFWEQGKF